MAEYEHELPGPLKFLNKGADWFGRNVLGHVPGLGGEVREAMDPKASLWQQLQAAGLGGLMAGGAAMGGVGLARSLSGLGGLGSLAGLGEGGGLAGTLGAGVGAGAAAEGAAGGLAGTLGAGAADAALEGGGQAASRGVLSRLGGLVPKSKFGKFLLGVGALQGGSALYHKLAGGGATAGAEADEIAAALGIDAAEAETRLKGFHGLQRLGMDAATATARIFPELAQQQAEQTSVQEQLGMQMMSAMLNPYVQQVRAAAKQQADVLRGLLPQVGSAYRPVLSAYIGSQEAAYNQDAATQALAALTGGVGIPMSTYQKLSGSGGGSGVDALLSSLMQQ